MAENRMKIGVEKLFLSKKKGPVIIDGPKVGVERLIQFQEVSTQLRGLLLLYIVLKALSTDFLKFLVNLKK
jgi:hypothetical protein